MSMSLYLAVLSVDDTLVLATGMYGFMCTKQGRPWVFARERSVIFPSSDFSRAKCIAFVMMMMMMMMMMMIRMHYLESY